MGSEESRECNACTWAGKLADCIWLGSIGPLCPDCRETTEATAIIQPEAIASYEDCYECAGSGGVGPDNDPHELPCEVCHGAGEVQVACTSVTMSQAALDVLSERRRQIEAEGWTPEHDDAHSRGELSYAATSYAVESGHLLSGMLPDASREPPFAWPWDKKWWKSGSVRRNLVKAGALILAEIERLDRADVKSAANRSSKAS